MNVVCWLSYTMSMIDEWTCVHQIVAALNQETDLQRALQMVLVRLGDLLDLHTGWVFLVDERDGSFFVAAEYNLPPALTDLSGPCDCQSAVEINSFACSRFKEQGVRCHVSIPLHAGDTRVGLINLASADDYEIPETALELLHTVSNVVGMVVGRSRRSRTLTDSLRHLLYGIDLETNLQVHTEVMGNEPLVPRSIAIHLYHIAREAIDNVRKHAYARRIKVRLVRVPNQVHLIIQDDGRGFEVSGTVGNGGGLAAMDRQVRQIGGVLNVSSTPDVGTFIDVMVPLSRSHDST